MKGEKVAASPSSVAIEVPRQHAEPGAVIGIEIVIVIGIERETVIGTGIGTEIGIGTVHQGETEIAVGNAALVGVARSEA